MSEHVTYEPRLVSVEPIRIIDRARRWLEEAHSRKLPTRELRTAEQEETRAGRAAVEVFAAVNGWKRAPASCSLDCLGRGLSTRSYFWSGDNEDHDLLDHGVWFRGAQRYVAVLGQPYMAAVDLPEWRDCLAARGFALHVPPDPLASFHFPGSTLFVVVTRSGATVRFLPEQDGRLRTLWPIEHD